MRVRVCAYSEKQKTEFCVGNVIRRTLYIIREEYVSTWKERENAQTDEKEHNQAPALHLNVLSELAPKIDYSMPLKEFKSSVMLAVQMFIEELDNVHNLIANQSIRHIHNDEVIMTLGMSRTVEQFLVTAARKRKFEVFVVECAPMLHGHGTAVRLAKEGISTTLITDAAVFAIMARVNKVIVGTHAVMANGGLIAPVGTSLLAQAAKYYNVPLIVCAGLFKLTPLFAFDHQTYNEVASPEALIPFHEAEDFRSVHGEFPLYDYVPPDLISLLIANL